jgi:hypothetical protein
MALATSLGDAREEIESWRVDYNAHRPHRPRGNLTLSEFATSRQDNGLRYTKHAIAATGISSEGVKTEFEQHAKEEHEHMTAVAERIDQKLNLIAERVAIDPYRESIRSFGERDPGTRTMPEGILVLEEEHTYDMHDLFVAHEGAPMLPDSGAATGGPRRHRAKCCQQNDRLKRVSTRCR